MYGFNGQLVKVINPLVGHSSFDCLLFFLGSLKMLAFENEKMHLSLCYASQSNQSETCHLEKSEHFIVQRDLETDSNDTMLWLLSHCTGVNEDDFLVSDNLGKMI
jgi:hypothetical protein